MKASKMVVAAVGVLLAYAAMGRDDQVWFMGTVEGHPFKDEEAGAWKPTVLKYEQEVRYDNSRLIDEESLLLIGYEFSPYLSIHVGDRYVRERKSSGEGKMRVENRPTFDVCLSAPEFWKLKFDYRSRFELRQKSGSEDYVCYRERLRLRTSWNVTDFQFSPYASEELFFEDKPHQSNGNAFDRSRSQVGLSFLPVPSVKGLSCNLYFMVQHDNSHRPDKWDPTNVYGFEITYKF